MSTGLVIAIVIGGTLLLFGGVAAFLVWIRRATGGHVPASPEQVRQAVAQQGWTFAERDDSFIPLYDRQHDRRSRWQPLQHPPRAKAARNVITGAHRGRPFVAATFDTVYQGKHQQERAIWVSTPGPHPMLSIQRVIGPQNAVNQAIGRGGVTTGHPDFDRQFEVLSEHAGFAQAVLGPHLLQFLLTDPRQFRGVLLHGESLDALDPVSDHRDPAQLAPALDLRCDILDRIPAHAWA